MGEKHIKNNVKYLGIIAQNGVWDGVVEWVNMPVIFQGRKKPSPVVNS